MNKEIPLQAYTVMEGYIGYIPMGISLLQTVLQRQHKKLPLLRRNAATNPHAVSESVNPHPVPTYPVIAV